MFGINYKSFINENIETKIQEYIAWLDTKNNWNKVEISFADANDEIFTQLHTEYKCTHPKKLYRPGNTLICHFLSIKQELIEDYKEGKISEENWEKICLETRQVSRGITDAIISTLQSYGREVSLLSELDGWSNMYGAEVAGLGKFIKEDYMFHRGNQIGCIGSVATEVEIKK